MIVRREMVLVWLLSLVVAPWAIADDEPAAPLPDMSQVKFSAPPTASAQAALQKAKPHIAKPSAGRKRPAAADGRAAAARQAMSEPLGFRQSHINRTVGGGVQRANFQAPISEAGPAATSAAVTGPGPIQDSNVQPAQYAAPMPSEPLGFSGSHFQESAGVDPSMGSEVFEDPYPPLEESLDPNAPAPTISSGEWMRGGYWYTQQSAVFMNRSSNVKNSIILSTDFTSSNIPHYLNFLQIPIDPGFRPGVRSTVGRYLGRDAKNRDHSVEFTFLGFSNWRASDGITAVSPGGIFSNVDPSNATPVFTGSNSQTFAEASLFDSYELNYRIDRRPKRDQMIYTRDSTWIRQATPSRLPAIFGGLRVVTINERLNYLATSNTGNGAYNIFTHNTLVGPQAGLDWYYDHNDWRVGVRAKGGAMVNFTDQTSQLSTVDFNGAPLAPAKNQKASDNILGFVGELNFIGAYRLRQNFSLRVSYDMMWVTSLALAQNQINFFPTPVATISDNHGLFYQGVGIGFEFFR